MADEPSIAQPGFPLGPAGARRLRLVRATNVTLGTDPALPEPYRARFEGAPPKVRERGGVVTVEYGPRFRPTGWGGQAADITLNPSGGWRIEAGSARIISKLGIPQAMAKYLQPGPHRPALNKLDPLTAISRVIQSRQTVHIADYRADPSYTARDPLTVAGYWGGSAQVARASGSRAPWPGAGT